MTFTDQHNERERIKLENDIPTGQQADPLEGLEDIRARWSIPNTALTNSEPWLYMPNVAAQAAARQAVTDVPRLLRMIERLTEAQGIGRNG